MASYKLQVASYKFKSSSFELAVHVFLLTRGVDVPVNSELGTCHLSLVTCHFTVQQTCRTD